jgi:GTP-binding protein Era
LRSGFVSIVGRPNAGKSTLVNALTGEKVAIVTSKPQTTRTRIHGIVEVAAVKGQHPAAQIVFVDTPGVHKPSTLLDKQMMQVVYDSLESRDVVLVMVDASRRLELGETAGAPGEEAGALFEEVAARSEEMAEQVDLPEPAPVGLFEQADALAGVDEAASTGAPVSVTTAANAPARRRSREQSEDAFVFDLVKKLDCPVFLLINKIDLIPREKLLPMITELSAIRDFAEVILLSARKGDGLKRLVESLVKHLPEGERHFPKDQFTDQPERFIVAELIRERILMETGEEVPYASAVVIEQYEEPPPLRKGKKLTRLPLTRLAAAIYCERDGQKAILIGKGGSKLKAIGAGARQEIEKLLGTRVYLELHVIVEPGWRERRGFLDTLDWRRQLEEMAHRKEELAALEPLPSPQPERKTGSHTEPKTGPSKGARTGPIEEPE